MRFPLTLPSSSDHTHLGAGGNPGGGIQEDQISVSCPRCGPTIFRGPGRGTRRCAALAFTFAPEAGSQRMRDIINIGVTEEALLNTISKAVSAGWTQIKLYFMIGLPGKPGGCGASPAFAKGGAPGHLRCCGAGGRGSLTVTASVSNFVPKAHTRPSSGPARPPWPSLRSASNTLRQEIRTAGSA